MRAAVSLVLATALVTTPLKLVLAQAAGQQAATVQQTTAQDSSRTAGLIRVPPVTDKTAQLLEPRTSEDALAAIFADGETWANPNGPAAPRAVPKGAKIAIYIVGVLAILFLLAVAGCAGDGGGDIC